MTTEERAPVSLRTIGEEDRKLAFSFLRYVQSVEVNSDCKEGIIHLVSQAFEIDAAGVGGKHDAEVDIAAAFSTALNAKGSGEGDEKFKNFLSVLEKKGYFKDADPGTDVYKDRLAKARAKFDQRNNPFEGLSVDEIKAKGNELMGQSKYKEAIQYYTKAIEMDPQNYICYANRAAAHLHLNDNAVAIIDCEKAIAINDKYPKAYARMGTAFFYDGKYSQAVAAFNYAVKLDPENATYKEDLKRAEERQSTMAPAQQGFPGMMGGMPGAGGMPGMDQMMTMMQDPRFSSMMDKMMSDPNMMAMAQNMGQKMFQNGGMPGMPGMPGVPGMPGIPDAPPQVDAEGNVVTPFGKMNKDRLEAMRNDTQNNPKMQAVMEDVRVNGMGAFYKHMGDPEVMEVMMKFSQEMMANPPQQ